MREEVCSVARKSPSYAFLVHLDLSPVFYAPSWALCLAVFYILSHLVLAPRDFFSHPPAIWSHSRVIRPLNIPAALSFRASQGGNNLGHIIIVSLTALSWGGFSYHFQWIKFSIIWCLPPLYYIYIPTCQRRKRSGMAVVANGFLAKLTLEIRADPEKGKGNAAEENLSMPFILQKPHWNPSWTAIG